SRRAAEGGRVGVTPERVWTVRDALGWTVGYFERKDVDAPRRSAEWLLSAATGLSRVELYAQHDRLLTDGERADLRAGVERRAAGEPLQYVTGEVPFRHLVLKVCPGVFIPRPETEVLVDEALAALPPAAGEVVGGADGGRAQGGTADGTGPIVVDLCTGSGAVALSIAHERPDARLWATEIAPATAEVARENAERCGLSERVTVLAGDLFSPLPDQLRGGVDLVVANPPYIPASDLAGLPAEVAGFEPRVALDGGADGLDVARRIAAEALAWLRPGGTLALELDEGRVLAAAAEAAGWGYADARAVRDLTGRDRVLIARASAPG
ncbi:MAG TPA: peptide chain release factor N(5)-glutamine methyltransferase, partial [Coriobacteriia bacterium]